MIDMTEELKKAASYFYVEKIYMKDRKTGELGMHFSNPRNMKLSYALDDKYKVDWEDVDAIYCTVEYVENKLYTIDNICKHWKHACSIARELNCKVIYYIACSKFIVSSESNEYMMDELMPKPSFFNSYYNCDYFLHSRFEDFDCNADIIIKMKMKQVGPVKMPLLTKQYFEYMDNHNSFIYRTNRLLVEVEQEYKAIAYMKYKSYLKLGESYNDLEVDGKEIESFSDNNKKLASKLLKIVYAVFDHFEYMSSPECGVVSSDDAWNAIMEEINFIIAYQFATETNDKNLKYIIIAIKNHCINNNMIPDPWEELENMRWTDKEYIEKIKKKMIKV